MIYVTLMSAAKTWQQNPRLGFDRNNGGTKI